MLNKIQRKKEWFGGIKKGTKAASLPPGVYVSCFTVAVAVRRIQALVQANGGLI